MNFDEYQTKAHFTAKYNLAPYMEVFYESDWDGNTNKDEFINNVPSYPFIKVMAESAELAEPAIKSALRGDNIPISEIDLEKEIGDILWYCAEMATVLGIKLDSIAQLNLIKLEDRAKRDVIKGSGDDR